MRTNKILFLAPVVVVFPGWYNVQTENDKLKSHLQNTTVLVMSADDSFGTGTFVRPNIVLTAAHVVEASHKKGIGVEVVKLTYNDKHVVATQRYEKPNAKIIAYSDPKHGYDIALLKLKNIETKKTISFSEKVLERGNPIWHCGPFGVVQGKLLGIDYALTEGVFDACECEIPVVAGSSGGGVFNKEGRYIGMIILASNENERECYFLPTRKIKSWARANQLDWLFNQKLPAP